MFPQMNEVSILEQEIPGDRFYGPQRFTEQMIKPVLDCLKNGSSLLLQTKY